jgi:hypothetical protein
MTTSKIIAFDEILIDPKEEEGTCEMNYYGRSEKSDKIEKLLLSVQVSGVLSGPWVEKLHFFVSSGDPLFWLL